MVYSLCYMPKQIKTTTEAGETLFAWTVQEYDQHERGMVWYSIVGTIGLLLIVFGIWSDNFLFALIIILASVILFLQSHQAPPQVPFRITETGIMINNRLYLYSEFEAFYIIYQPPEVKTLFLDTKSPFRPILRIPLLDMNPLEIRQTLRQYLSEDTEKEEEPLTDTIARRWKLH